MDKGRYGISKAFDKAVDDFCKSHEKFEKIYAKYETLKNKGVANVNR